MGNEKWQMADGGWQMADGGWQMADGGWRMADGKCRDRKGRPRFLGARKWVAPPHGWAAASGEEKFDLTERIVRFGDILNTEGPLVEIRSRLVFANQAVVWMAVASGEGPAHDLTPLDRRVASGGRTVARWTLGANQVSRVAESRWHLPLFRSQR